MKKIHISESDLANIIQNKILKKLNEQIFSDQSDSPNMTPREIEIDNIFGSYRGEVPLEVIRYMRKNPKLILSRLYDIYGDKLFDYIEDIFNKKQDSQYLDEQTNQGEFDDSNLTDDEEEMTPKYPVDDWDFMLDKSDINDIYDHKGPMRRFRGSIYVDGVVPETDDKTYDRKLATKMLEYYRNEMSTGESYVGGVGFKQKSLLNPYDTMDF